MAASFTSSSPVRPPGPGLLLSTMDYPHFNPRARPSFALPLTPQHGFGNPFGLGYSGLDLSTSSPSSSSTSSGLSIYAASPPYMFSPRSMSPMISPMYDGARYLQKLQSHPMFQDLQMLLAQECLHLQVPSSLITANWNMADLRASSSGALGSSQMVYSRHMQLQQRLIMLRSEPERRMLGLQLDKFYSTEVGKIEMGRYQALCSSIGQDQVKVAINTYYDKERLNLVSTVEEKLEAAVGPQSSLTDIPSDSPKDLSSDSPDAADKLDSSTSDKLHVCAGLDSDIPTSLENSESSGHPNDWSKDGDTQSGEDRHASPLLDCGSVPRPSHHQTGPALAVAHQGRPLLDKPLAVAHQGRPLLDKPLAVAHQGRPVLDKLLAVAHQGRQLYRPYQDSNPVSAHSPVGNEEKPISRPTATVHHRGDQSHNTSSVHQGSELLQNAMNPIGGLPSQFPVHNRQSVCFDSGALNLSGYTGDLSESDSSTSSFSPAPVQPGQCKLERNNINSTVCTNGRVPSGGDHGNRLLPPGKECADRLVTSVTSCVDRVCGENSTVQGMCDRARDLSGTRRRLLPALAESYRGNGQTFSSSCASDSVDGGRSGARVTSPVNVSAEFDDSDSDADSVVVDVESLDTHIGEEQLVDSSTHVVGAPSDGDQWCSDASVIRQYYTSFSGHPAEPVSHGVSNSDIEPVNYCHSKLTETPTSNQSVSHVTNYAVPSSFHSNQCESQKDFAVTPGGRLLGLTPGVGSCEVFETPTSTKRKHSDTADFDGVDLSRSPKCIREDETPILRTSRLLKGNATVILNEWYACNVHYPYPLDETVEQLSKAAGITPLQVKKWMANKRVRCFNTLSINGRDHPIKYRYRGAKSKPADKVPQEHPEGSSTGSDTENAQPVRTNYQKLGPRVRVVLNEWYNQHAENPYPSEEEKAELAECCNMSVLQVRSWFANKRSRANNTRRQVPNYFINQYPEYSPLVEMVIKRREDNRMRRKKKPALPYSYVHNPY